MNCHICGQEFAEADMISLEGRPVCASCKPLLVQQMKEGCLPALAAPALEPEISRELLSFPALLALTWKIMRLEWRTISGLMLLISVPVNLLHSALEPDDTDALRAFARSWLMGDLFEILVGVLTSLGIAYAISERIHGRPVTFGAVLRHAFSRWLPGITTGVLGSIIAYLLLLLLVIPGVVWYFYYTFSISVVSLRDRAGMRALGYSKRLVQGRWWAVVGRVVGLLAIATSFMVVLIVPLHFFLEPENAEVVGDLLMDVVLICVGNAFIGVGCVVLFLNLDALERQRPTGAIGPGAD